MIGEGARRVFETAERKSEEGLSAFRKSAASIFGRNENLIVGVNGSYARREATSGSDVDVFVLYWGGDKREAQEQQSAFRRVLADSGFDMPAPGGVFSEPLSVSTLSDMIGGMDDTNMQLTRRMLLLLEGEWVHNEDGFHKARRQLLQQYVPSVLRPEQICLFLLNDVIRYWRTICVDFEYKVQHDGKPRAIRLIKLRFSRMLLFIAGVLAIGETQGLSVDKKLRHLEQALAMPAFKRLEAIAGDKADPALELYASFLSALDDKVVRAALSQPSPEGEDSAEFQGLRREAQKFRDSLIQLLETHLPKGHPLIPALML